MLVLLLGASHTARAQKQLYTATIQSDGVKIDFDLEECGRYADAFLNHPARITRSAMVEGLSGRVVELLKTNIGPDWKSGACHADGRWQGVLAQCPRNHGYG